MVKNPYLHRYWITVEFPKPQRPRGIYTGIRNPVSGYGVTAYTVDDALMILEKQLRLREPFPSVLSIQEDFDVSTLDAKHILTNIGVTVFRGTWYPNIGPYDGRVIP